MPGQDGPVGSGACRGDTVPKPQGYRRYERHRGHARADGIRRTGEVEVRHVFVASFLRPLEPPTHRGEGGVRNATTGPEGNQYERGGVRVKARVRVRVDPNPTDARRAAPSCP